MLEVNLLLSLDEVQNWLRITLVKKENLNEQLVSEGSPLLHWLGEPFF
jgi:hypothetical protein